LGVDARAHGGGGGAPRALAGRAVRSALRPVHRDGHRRDSHGQRRPRPAHRGPLARLRVRGREPLPLPRRRRGSVWPRGGGRLAGVGRARDRAARRGHTARTPSRSHGAGGVNGGSHAAERGPAEQPAPRSRASHLMTASLLDPACLRRREALRRSLVSSVRSGGAGERAARRRGASAEFLDHRRYEPGDDPRHIHWAAFARTRETVTKLYRAEEDTVLRLVLDASASLGFGDPPKLAVARRLAAALAYLSLAGGGRTELRIARSTSDGVPLVRAGPVRRGRAAFAPVCRE